MKIVFFILVLAVYGAYSLGSKFVAPAAQGEDPSGSIAPAPEACAAGGCLSSVGERVVAYGAEAAGLSWRPVDVAGCQQAAGEALSPERLNAFLEAIPAGAQREALAQLLAKLPQVPLYLYQGPEGAGLCVLSMNRMLLLPPSVAVIPQGLTPNQATNP